MLLLRVLVLMEAIFEEPQWASNVPFGGNTRTRMDNVDMRGVSALSCIFNNISFRGAKMGTYVAQSVHSNTAHSRIVTLKVQTGRVLFSTLHNLTTNVTESLLSYVVA